MIKFLQDYTTTALPPEHFERGQEVSERSPDSEMYFVKLGVAALVVDGKLVDQDYNPVVFEPVAVVVGAVADRRFGGGRGGETLGLTAPQRASNGPGNAVMFAAAATDAAPNGVEVEQLRSDLAASSKQYEGHVENLTGMQAQLDQAKADAEAAVTRADKLEERLAAIEALGLADKLAPIEERLAAIEAARAPNTSGDGQAGRTVRRGS
ncbi:hypothetical protein [Sphingomonas sp.]|uniref:hypothetical protein n=1 Tax=Sphingomonas sp. TaxID=28214 RepID=UPI003B000158